MLSYHMVELIGSIDQLLPGLGYGIDFSFSFELLVDLGREVVDQNHVFFGDLGLLDASNYHLICNVYSILLMLLFIL